jgi:hypothetical protein
MITLFDNGRTVEARTVAEWGHLASASGSSIGLPAFQRSAAWDERRVEVLWDSVTRGFPIGAFLFFRPSDFTNSTDVTPWKPLAAAPMASTTRLAHSPISFLLIDGQQRLTSLQLGFRPFRDDDASRLWIDLAPPVTKEARKRGRFRLCSRVHPWGMGASVARRREARARIGRGDSIDDTDISLRVTWPVDARVPVDAAALIARMLEGLPGVLPTWNDLLPEHFSEELLESARKDVDGPSGVQEILDGLLRLKCVRVVGMLVENINDIKELGEAFARLNTQGVAISQEELFFSALKIRWPGSSDLVAEIVEDPDAGKLLPATKIVHLATRIVVSETPSRDVDVLTLEDFVRIEERSEIALVPRLQELLAQSGGAGGRGRLHGALACARRMLQYRQTSDQPDPGLPRTLLGHIHWRSWHAVAAWAERHGLRVEEVDDASRLEALRLVMLLHFFVTTDSRQVSGLAQQFPGALIAASLHSNRLISVEPLDPGAFRVWLSNEGEEGKGRATEPRLVNEQHLLHWAQRRWLHDWYPRYDPTLYNSLDDMPFDVDHIMPAHAFDGRGATWCPEFIRDLGALRSSLGNLRIWPREANRQDQAATPDAKLFLDSESGAPLVDEVLLGGRPCGFRVAGDVRMASLIDEDQRGLWLRASQAPNLKNWGDPGRLSALRRAIDERRARLYESLWRGLDFGSWWSEVCRLSEEISTADRGDATSVEPSSGDSGPAGQ